MEGKQEKIRTPVEKRRCVNVLECLGTGFQRNCVILLKEVHEEEKFVTTFNSDLHFKRKTECGPAPLGNMRTKNISYTKNPLKLEGIAIMYQCIQR